MASTTGPDLTTGQEAVERLMDDACIVTYDTQGIGDDVLDPITLVVVQPIGDSSQIYDQTSTGLGGRSLADADLVGGRCKISPASQSDIASMVTEGGVQEVTEFYKVSLPIDSPFLPTGALITLVSSRRDPELVNKTFRVRKPVFTTFLMSRKYLTELRS